MKVLNYRVNSDIKSVINDALNHELERIKSANVLINENFCRGLCDSLTYSSKNMRKIFGDLKKEIIKVMDEWKFDI